MEIIVDKFSKTALYKQIIEQIVNQIITGTLLPGYQLPPERQLAKTLGVNRTTVLNAYRELKAEGLVDSHVGKGTVVLERTKPEVHPTAICNDPIWEHFLSEYPRRINGDTVSDILELVNRTDIISFAAGLASLENRPVKALIGIEKDLLESKDRKALLVSPVAGFSSLRTALSDYMTEKGCFCQPSEIMILSGSQQGIDLVARALINPGDIVLIEEPSFFPAIDSFKAAGAKLMGIPMMDDGMDIDVLEQLLQRYHPKLIYTMSTNHNPSGITMSMSKRVRILELISKYRVPLLEDSAYSELCYNGYTIPSLKSMDKSGYVIYINTFSKTVYPGLRLGWMCAHKKLILQLVAIRQLVDIHANSLSQQIIERFIRNRGIDDYIKLVSEEYMQRRDLMIAAFEKYAPQGLLWNKPGGGYYIWCSLPQGISATKLVPKAAEYGVAVLPGTSFFLTRQQGEGFLRLNYTYAPRNDIDKGVKALCDAVKELMQNQKVTDTSGDLELNPII